MSGPNPTNAGITPQSPEQKLTIFDAAGLAVLRGIFGSDEDVQRLSVSVTQYCNAKTANETPPNLSQIINHLETGCERSKALVDWLAATLHNESLESDLRDACFFDDATDSRNEIAQQILKLHRALTAQTEFRKQQRAALQAPTAGRPQALPEIRMRSGRVIDLTNYLLVDEILTMLEMRGVDPGTGIDDPAVHVLKIVSDSIPEKILPRDREDLSKLVKRVYKRRQSLKELFLLQK